MASLLLAIAVDMLAQNSVITGKVIEKDTKSAAVNATVQLLRQNSTFAGGAITSASGSFKINVAKSGNYILKVSSIGFNTYIKSVKVGAEGYNAGTVILRPNSIMLKGAVITAQASKVTTIADTFVYKADAYRVPEGSVLEELVKKLPGATVEDDGTIKINGKEVKKIMIDGKEFFTGDTKTAMKNIPTSMIEKVKAYDQQSDLARITGIDDGEEQTVLDIGVKPGMNKGAITNNDVGIGTHDRYSARLMGGYFTDKIHVMGFGNANNTNDMGFPGGGGGRWGGGRQGLNASKMFGVNFNYEKKNKLEFDGNVRWNHRDSDTQSKQSSENFVSTQSSFSNSHRTEMNRSNEWNSQFRLEWNPDTMTDIIFRPTLSYSTNDSHSSNTSASYNADPFSFSSITDPLSSDAIAMLAQNGAMVNTRSSQSISYSRDKALGGELQFNRRLNSHGRNITLRLTGNYSDTDSKSLSTSNVHLYKIKDAQGNDSTYQTNRYNVTPAKSWDYSAQFSYSEPIFKSAFLQFSYRFRYKYNKSDRATYDFSEVGDLFNSVIPNYRKWGDYLSLLPNSLDGYRDADLSRFSEYKNYIHDIRFMLRIINRNYFFNAGVHYIPQTSHYTQNYQGVHTDTVRNVSNISPSIFFRYKFSKVSQLRITYRGNTSQPSISQLLDITDDSNPMNITKGNPELKPAFTNSLNAFYNNYIQNHQQGIMVNLSYNNTTNSISNMVRYDDTTGARTTRPENINGNWDANAMLMYNTSLDSAGHWNINTFSTLQYNHYVGYLSLSKTENSKKNTTKSASYGERLSASYRNDWLEIELNGNLRYTHSRNELQPTSNLDTWQYRYGGNVSIMFPWNMRIATNLHESCRRGYSDASMNTDELLWNAQISQSLLQGSPLTISLQFYDILSQQSNISRAISSTQRSDTEYNAINSYAMLHIIYRFNAFGNKDMRQLMHRDDHDRFGGHQGGFGNSKHGGGGYGGGYHGGGFWDSR